MAEASVYSARSVFEGLKRVLHQYLEAQYHIWDEGLIAERRRILESPGNSFQEPRLEATPSYHSGKPYSELQIPRVAQELLTLGAKRPGIGIFPEPYAHQAAALEATLGRDEEIIVATGTGSGKTESFLLPILGTLAVESASRPTSWLQPGVRALLLYPMNALVNDQLSRLRRLLGDEVVAAALKGQRPGHVWHVYQQNAISRPIDCGARQGPDRCVARTVVRRNLRRITRALAPGREMASEGFGALCGDVISDWASRVLKNPS